MKLPVVWLLVIWLIANSIQGESDKEKVRDLARKILSDPRYQKDLFKKIIREPLPISERPKHPEKKNDTRTPANRNQNTSRPKQEQDQPQDWVRQGQNRQSTGSRSEKRNDPGVPRNTGQDRDGTTGIPGKTGQDRDGTTGIPGKTGQDRDGTTGVPGNTCIDPEPIAIDLPRNFGQNPRGTVPRIPGDPNLGETGVPGENRDGDLEPGRNDRSGTPSISGKPGTGKPKNSKGDRQTGRQKPSQKQAGTKGSPKPDQGTEIRSSGPENRGEKPQTNTADTAHDQRPQPDNALTQPVPRPPERPLNPLPEPKPVKPPPEPRRTTAGWAGKVLLYLFGAVAALCLIYLIISGISRWHRKPAAGTTAPVASPSPVPQAKAPEAPTTEAGYLEACRKTMREALQFLCERRYLSSPDALTNCEVIAGLPSEYRGKEALRVMSRVIEKGYYAQRPIVAEDYRQCLMSLQAIQSSN